MAGLAASLGVRVGREVRLAAALVRDVGIELGGGEICVPEHLLDAAQVGAALQQVCGEGVPEEMRVYATCLEPGFLGKPPQDQEDTGARQLPASRVEEEGLGAAAVEKGAPAEI